jgi:hypothetical protein
MQIDGAFLHTSMARAALNVSQRPERQSFIMFGSLHTKNINRNAARLIDLRQSSDLAPKEGREFMRRGTGFRRLGEKDWKFEGRFCSAVR